jgi:thiol:disulfide interchange protein
MFQWVSTMFFSFGISRNALSRAVALLGALVMTSSVAALSQSAFYVKKDLYSATADPAADIAAAQVAARHAHKHILLEFGGNWCADCQLLNYYYHQPPNAELLAKYYLVVTIDIGHMDHNMDIAEKYRVPVAKGVPALAVLDANGKLLYSERQKEFEHTSPEAVAAFLNHWKPAAK